MRFNIIGAGRLGTALASALIKQGGVLVAVCNRSLGSAVSAVNKIGMGTAIDDLAALPTADFVFLTTPDDSLSSVVEDLAEFSVLVPGTIVAHCSGVLDSTLLQPLENLGCYVASVHPLKAFRKDGIQSDVFGGCHCVIEGQAFAETQLRLLFEQMGARVSSIHCAKKSVYHAAAVMASNYVVTLANCARTLLHDAGMTQDLSALMIRHLMQSSLDNLEQTMNPADALTGPLSRGDVGTITRHLKAIDAPNIRALYSAAGLATIPLADIDEKTKQVVRSVLLSTICQDMVGFDESYFDNSSMNLKLTGIT